AEPASTPVPPIVGHVLRSPGRPLDRHTRELMGSRFGHDFSQVRVHTDERAAASAHAVNALAYTVGRDIVFAAGRYAPATTAGQKLLAHELAHTVQQGAAAGLAATLDVTRPADPLEREADAASDAVMNGQPAAITRTGGALLSRQIDGDAETAEAPDDAGAVPVDQKAATACPVQSTGTLSEISWGETSGLYPTAENKFNPEKWDAAKTCELLKARGAVHEVGQRGESVHRAKPKAKDKIEQMLKIYHFTENFPARDSTISDAGVKWFYLSPDADKPEAHPGAKGSKRVQTYGSFYNIGGGDVKAGAVYIHFYKLES
ncbi:MAG TPA: DUF4157 domain-containing protein, partial [Thermoanaerobaculia bacterium]